MARIKSHQEKGHEWMDEIFIRAFVAYLYLHMCEFLPLNPPILQKFIIFQRCSEAKHKKFKSVAKFKDRWRIESTRLQNWDYGWNGYYFITICTAHRRYFFGDICGGIMNLSETGQFALQFWNEIPNHFPFIILDAFVVMPNHVHGILIVDRDEDNGNVETRHCLVSTGKNPHIPEKPLTNGQSPTPLTPGQKRFRNPGKNTLSSIIGSYKSIVTRHARKIIPEFGWQKRFYDHIIRNDGSYARIRQYIINNPNNWKNDRFYD